MLCVIQMDTSNLQERLEICIWIFVAILWALVSNLLLIVTIFEFIHMLHTFSNM